MQTFYADWLNNLQELHDDVAKTIEGLTLEALSHHFAFLYYRYSNTWVLEEVYIRVYLLDCYFEH